MWYGGHESWIALVIFGALFSLRMLAAQRRRSGHGRRGAAAGFFSPTTSTPHSSGSSAKGQEGTPDGGSGLPGGSRLPGGSVGIPPGWFTDPFVRHEQRYWSGTAWTEHVIDGDVPATDPPPGNDSTASS
ncbi:MAG: DUF2510 domain-containing protein [Acidimicrobiales bacterium]